MRLRNIFRNSLGTAALSLFLVLFTGCNKTPLDSASVSIRNKFVDTKAGSQFLTINASGDWTVTLDTGDGSQEVDWVWFSAWDNPEGTITVTREEAAGKPVVVYYAANLSDKQRSCTIRLTCGAAVSSCELTQDRSARHEETPDKIKSDPVPMWLELPATREGDGRYFISHEMKLGATYFRNYSYYLDVKDIEAYWVAYPLNRWTIGSGSRTNAWGVLDPRVPRENQAVLFGGFGGGYDRGHQCPSADRYTPGANEATFYGTNMTPQMSNFNQNIWASLEGSVRTWAGQMDTLYVVTGCDTRGATGSRYDSDGKSITIPTAYFKVLLGYKKSGSIGVAGGSGSYAGRYTGIAFYLKHKSYGVSSSEIRNNLNDSCMSIDELEELLGDDFFPNLVGILGEEKAAQVEHARDSFWKL